MDLKALENELIQARQAKLDALAATTEVEDMILNVQDPEFGRARLAFFISGFDEDVEAETVEAAAVEATH
jgi:hypothetical protein